MIRMNDRLEKIKENLKEGDYADSEEIEYLMSVIERKENWFIKATEERNKLQDEVERLRVENEQLKKHPDELVIDGEIHHVKRMI